MTFNLNPKLPAQNATNSGQTTPLTVGSNAPSVPISVYRELAAELQATKVMLDSLNSQNQQLTQQNQQLRREIEKVVQVTLHLQQIADSSVPASWGEIPHTHPEMRHEPKRSTPKRPRPAAGSHPTPGVEVSAMPEAEYSVFSAEKLVMEQPEGRYRRRSQPVKSSDMNAWWITLIIVAIVITAFGAGFTIMRPLLLRR